MNQRRTIVNTALSNRPAGTVVMVAALLGGLYYLYCPAQPIRMRA